MRVRKKIEWQEAMEWKDEKKKKTQQKAHNLKKKEVSQLWLDKEFLKAAGYEVDLPIRSSQ